MIKRLLAFIMVLLLSIESFAAVVGDNDGAAFITKAEFDSMKNEFQSQINKYNSSIDNKIDGAIAGYLEGIVIKKDPDNLYNYVRSSIGSNLRFLNNFDNEWTVGTSTDTSQVSAVHLRSYNYKKSGAGLEGDVALWQAISNTGTSAEFYFDYWDSTPVNIDMSNANIKQLAVVSGGYSSTTYVPYYCDIYWANDFKSYAKDFYWIMNYIPKGGLSSPNFSAAVSSKYGNGDQGCIGLGGFNKQKLWENSYSRDWTNITSVAILSPYITISNSRSSYIALLGSNNSWGGVAGTQWAEWGQNMGTFFQDGTLNTRLSTYTSKTNPFALVTPTVKGNINKYLALYVSGSYLKGEWINAIPDTFKSPSYASQLATHVKSQSGAGKAWRYRALPNGNKTITAYCSTLHPSITFNLKYHSYQDMSSASPAADSYSDTTDRSQTVNNAATLGVTSGGTEYNPSSTSTGGYWQQILSVSEVSDPVVFETAQWGSDLSGNVYMVPEKGYTVARNSTLGTTITDGPKIEWTDDGFSQKANAVKNNNVYAMKVNRETLAKTSFENSYLSSVAGETVYVGGGCPVARLNSADETTLKLDFLVKNKANAGTNQSGSVINYKVSNKQFTAGNVSAGAENIATGTVTSNSSGTASVTVNVPEFPSGTTIWVTAYSSTKPHVVEITGITTKLKN